MKTYEMPFAPGNHWKKSAGFFPHSLSLSTLEDDFGIERGDHRREITSMTLHRNIRTLHRTGTEGTINFAAFLVLSGMILVGLLVLATPPGIM
jgi:hypothetical protein